MNFALSTTDHSYTVIAEVERKKGGAVLLARTDIMNHDCFSKLRSTEVFRINI
jgi:hypothetical protein